MEGARLETFEERRAVAETEGAVAFIIMLEIG
jgi:hypothetical protein